METKITFKENTKVAVYLDGKFTGNIVNVDGGYQYIVKGGRHRGEVYPTLEATKHSLTLHT